MEGISLVQIIVLLIFTIVYFFLITEKINKVIVAILGASALILLQIFKTETGSSQEVAFGYISNNLDVLGFIVGMMILIGVIQRAGFFDAAAIYLVKKIKGDPKLLLILIGYLSFILTVFISNIPTILILTPILLVLIRQLKVPPFPYLFAMVVMANIAGAVTPISDPTTYYQAKTVGLSFTEVLSNSGLVAIVLSFVSMGFMLLMFRSQLNVKVNAKSVMGYKPQAAIKDQKQTYMGIALLIVTILFVVLKDPIGSLFDIQLDNATIIFTSAFISILLFKVEINEVFKNIIDWEIIFFFMGIFIVVGGLEHTGIIDYLAEIIIDITAGDDSFLLLAMTSGSAILSVFVDNVPYNITMVSAVQSMANEGVNVYPLWWGLNLGTSIGGAGSIIGAACNVVAFGQAEKEKIHVTFVKYLKYGFPLVLINSLVAFAILWLKFLA